VSANNAAGGTAGTGGTAGAGGAGGAGGNGNAGYTNHTAAYGGTGGKGGLGGTGGVGGAGSGGCLYATGAAATLANDTMSGNKATGGQGGNGSAGGQGGAGGARGTAKSGANGAPGFGGLTGTGGGGGVGGAGSGGGLYATGGAVTLINDSLTGNSATGGNAGNGGNGATQSFTGGYAGNGGNGGAGSGGGLYALSGSTAILANTLIAQNTTAGGTKGAPGNAKFFTRAGQAGTSGSASAPDFSGTVASSDHDLVGNGTGSNLTNGSNGDQVGSAAPFTGDLTQGSATIENVSSMTGLVVGQLVTDTAGALPAGTFIAGLGQGTITLSQSATNSQTGDGFTSSVYADLGPLQNNGGPLAGAPGSQQVVSTIALLPGSVAIDAGDSSAAGLPSTDERGLPRINGAAVDIGAFEFYASVDGNGVLQIEGSNAKDTIVLRPNPADPSQTEVVDNGTVIGTFANASFSAIHVALLAGNLTLADTGGSSGLGFFGVPVTVDGSGANTLTLNDSTSSSANTYTVTSTTISRSGFGGLTYANLGQLFLADGSGSNIINVLSTSANLAVFSQGQDSIFVGSNGSAPGGNVQGIGGRVLVLGTGATGLSVDDSGDTIGRTATLSKSPSFGGNFIGAITGLAPAPIEWVPTGTSSGLQGLVIYGGSGGNTFTVTGTTNFSSPTTLSTGTGDDTVNIAATSSALDVVNPGGQDVTYLGSGGSILNGTLAAINGPVNVQGAGATWLYLGDEGDSTGHTVTLGNGSITGLAPATISWTPSASAYGGVTYLEVFGSSGGSTYNVTGTSNFPYDTYLQTGPGNDALNIAATTGGLYVHNSGGTDNVVVGSLAPATTGGTLATINGFVNVAGAGSTNLTVDDSGDTLARKVTVTSAAVTGLGDPAPIDIAAGVSSLTINGSKGASTYTVQSTQAGTATTINAGPANDTFQVGDTTHALSGIQGFLTLNGGGGTDKATLVDIAQSATENYYLSTNAFTGAALAGVGFSGLKGLTVSAGTGTVGLVVTAAPTGLPVTFNGGGGTDFLIGPNDNNTWAITGNDAGKLTAASLTGKALGTVSFTKVQYLFGGTVADLFKLSPGKSLSGYIYGGSGIETLDYSLWTTGVTVNLGTHTATNIALGVYGVENIDGGKGNDSLTGDSQNNIIRGGGGNDTIVGGGGNDILIGGQGAASLSAAGSGRSILIGGKSTVPQTLTGSTQDDIFIGGYTSYDSYSLAHDQALLAILAEWTSADSEATRESKITSGVGPGAKDKFKLLTTVFSDGATDTINGNGAESGDSDWIINT
jgi:hypothetical protein